ncbi:MAG: phosphatidate cytidylyltransferase [Saprospiraceae bacterium]|jgi:phosphatidate cytidylyltransferase|nr:phosphatidate cytidylyltransferase [Saprospiraceae bacterium]MBK7797073.1 phosphatidate cytidylyltransferase [Saprospiraceae bacterium]MBX7163844.1 phosphatidate cytidylyltransferase [Saprospiraceae bacterium]
MLKRSITGFILAAVMIIAIYGHWISALILFLVILIFSSIEWSQNFISTELKRTRFYFLCASLLTGILLILITSHLIGHPEMSTIFFLGIFASTILYYFIDFTFRADPNQKKVLEWQAGVLYIGMPLIIGIMLLVSNFYVNRKILLGMIAINWASDVFAYIGGRLIGKTALAPAISPKKTVEGFISGGLAAILVGFLLNTYFYSEKMDMLPSIFFSIGIWVAGTAGDLFESRLKRIIGIKDSGNLLPGHGGFLDRFDSFFFIIPIGTIIYIFFKMYYQ